MPHLISLLLPILSIAHLLKVILVLLETSFGYMSLPRRILLALVALAADRHHPVVALLARIVVIVVLDVNLVVDVVHVLLL